MTEISAILTGDWLIVVTLIQYKIWRQLPWLDRLNFQAKCHLWGLLATEPLALITTSLAKAISRCAVGLLCTMLLPVSLAAGNKLHSLGNLEAERLTSYPPASRYCSTGKLKHYRADTRPSAFTRYHTWRGFHSFLSRERQTSIWDIEECVKRISGARLRVIY